jgi:hypothetical protein
MLGFYAIKTDIKMTQRIVIGLIILIVLSNCSSNNTQTKSSAPISKAIGKTDSVNLTIEESGNVVASENVNISFILPSPDEILEEILPPNVKVDYQYVNNKDNVSKYLNSRQQALNLGVYIADFAFLNLNDDKSYSLEYFKTIRNLAQKLNIYGVFKESLYDRVQRNLTNEDSLKDLSKELYYQMLGVLEESNRNNTYALVSSGALIETMYLSGMLVTNFADYQKIAQKIFEQKFVFDNFYEFAAQYKSDKDVSLVLKQFDDLKAIISSTTSKKTEKKVTVDRKDHFVISGGQEFVVNEEAFQKFKDSIIKIRANFTSVGKK